MNPEDGIYEPLIGYIVLASLTSEPRKFASVRFFGEAAGDRLKVDRYEEFCQWRADRLAESINDWLGID